MIYAGIDAGSRAVKIVLLDGPSGRIVASAIADQGVEQAKLAGRLYRQLLEENGIGESDVAGAVATGYGRAIVSVAGTTVTEITCHAAGVRRLVDTARTVIDIGGQDSKLLHLDTGGRVRDFAMNDRCAAGTGRFLEIVADRLAVRLCDLGELASQSRRPAQISSMCVVFAETEIVGLLASGAEPADIVAGVMHAIAGRTAAMAGAVVHGPVIFTGGVALVGGMDRALAEALGSEVAICPHPQITGALGAAIMAMRKD
ncbi:MAG: 2-hydroxyglutaryl-CoA dehydratase [Phycisphaerae bacterium]|nr:2-hydroxyglutaryl-CoA dehydratase [Phycisphaerae bacterium]